jgi:hypothetical protein
MTLVGDLDMDIVSDAGREAYGCDESLCSVFRHIAEEVTSELGCQ